MSQLARHFSVLILIATLGGCHGIVVAQHPHKPVVARRHGPPAHAPAHGHRHKHQSGPDLQFNSNLGVYVVLGQTDIYFHDGWFIRIHGDGWQVSSTLDGSWEARSGDWAPSGLRAKHHKKKHKSKGRGAAKHAW